MENDIFDMDVGRQIIKAIGESVLPSIQRAKLLSSVRPKVNTSAPAGAEASNPQAHNNAKEHVVHFSLHHFLKSKQWADLANPEVAMGNKVFTLINLATKGLNIWYAADAM